MIADLSRTEWLPPAEVHAGDSIVEWHDETGRAVFGELPRARRVVERIDDLEYVIFVFADRRRQHVKYDATVEVQR